MRADAFVALSRGHGALAAQMPTRRNAAAWWEWTFVAGVCLPARACTAGKACEQGFRPPIVEFEIAAVARTCRRAVRRHARSARPRSRIATRFQRRRRNADTRILPGTAWNCTDNE